MDKICVLSVFNLLNNKEFMKALNYRPQPAESKIAAMFDLEVDVKIPELDITVPWVNKNWKLLRTKNGGAFPVSPSFKEEVGGVAKWTNYDEIDPRFKTLITKTIAELLEPHLKQDNATKAQSPIQAEDIPF